LKFGPFYYSGMKKYLAGLFLCISIAGTSFAQQQPSFGIDFSGFVKTDIIHDSRQTVSIREGHFLLYPAPENLDVNGKDINAVSNFNILSIQTRLHGKITGPDALGAKTSGAIEGEFFGHSDGDINGFRLRHAFVKLNWTNTQLLVGQTWHPLFVTGCFPGVVSFNTGAPFLPFTRNPQVSLRQQLDGFSVMVTALTQRDFVSTGPDGASSKYLRNAGMPAVNLRLEYSSENKEDGTAVMAGLSGNYQVLKPRLVTTANYKTDETIGSMVGMAYLKVQLPEVTFKAAGIYGQDAYNLTMIGGYAVEEIVSETTMQEQYAPINTLSAWADMHTNNPVWQVGLFMGYSKNMGADGDLHSAPADFFSRGSNIDYLYRISPRFVYNSGKLRIAPEIEYTVAAYGATQSNAEVADVEEIGNLRFLIGIFYFF
jgi:hypothetical protein